MGGSSIDSLHKVWLKRPGYREAYAAQEDELAIAAALIEARSRAGLTQAQVARRMKTTQTAVARLESGRARPSTRTLGLYAAAVGARLRISFEPARSAKRG